jgi:hypothetical protein
MPRRAVKLNPPQPPDTPDPGEVALDDPATDLMFAEEAAPPGVAPAVEQRDGMRFEGQVDPGVTVIAEENYNRLKDFVAGRPDKTKYRLALFRCDPQVPEDSSRRKWLGKVSLPDGILEDELERRWGPGTYRWQLAFVNRFVGRKDLPPTMQDIPLEGFVTVDGLPREALVAEVDDSPADNGNIGLIREMLSLSREESKSQTASMVQMFGLLISGMQAQQAAAAQLATQQTQFLLNQMQMREQVFKETRAEKDGMWAKILEVVKDFGGKGSDSRDTTDRLLDNLPTIIGELNKLTAGRTPAAAPAAASAGQATSPAQVQPGVETSEVRTQKYVGEVLNEFVRWFRRGKDAEFIAGIISEVGGDDEYAWLMGQDTDTVVKYIGILHQQFLKAPAPPDMLAMATTVFSTLKKEWDEQQKEPAPEAPAAQAAPAAPAVATAPPNTALQG